MAAVSATTLVHYNEVGKPSAHSTLVCCVLNGLFALVQPPSPLKADPFTNSQKGDDAGKHKPLLSAKLFCCD